MPHRMRPAEGGNDLGLSEIIANQAKPLMGMKQSGLIQGYNAGGFLAAMLQGMQAKCGEGSSITAIPHAEDAAFLMRLVILKSRGQRHG
jgi:hypothetical protein